MKTRPVCNPSTSVCATPRACSSDTDLPKEPSSSCVARDAEYTRVTSRPATVPLVLSPSNVYLREYVRNTSANHLHAYTKRNSGDCNGAIGQAEKKGRPTLTNHKQTHMKGAERSRLVRACACACALMGLWVCACMCACAHVCVLTHFVPFERRHRAIWPANGAAV